MRNHGDLDDDEDLINFFNEVLEKREQLEDARGLEDQALVVEQIATDDASSGGSPGHASLGT